MLQTHLPLNRIMRIERRKKDGTKERSKVIGNQKKRSGNLNRNEGSLLGYVNILVFLRLTKEARNPTSRT